MDEPNAAELSTELSAAVTPATAATVTATTSTAGVDIKSADSGDSKPSANAFAVSTLATGKQRAGRRGLTTRKRLALKIDASEADGQKATEVRDGQLTSTAAPGDSASSTDANGVSDAVPWWILEYKCPPPGHLGAHDVPVAVKDDAKQATVGELLAVSSEANKQDEANAEHPQRTSGGQRTQSLAVANSATEQLLVESVVRDIRQRRQQQHTNSIDYSPSQKRKMDPSALSSAVVAKEPKRFHERSSSNEPPSDVSAPTVVTPSNLVRPLNKIDIHCQRSADASAAAASDAAKAPSASANHHASSSANHHASSSA